MDSALINIILSALVIVLAVLLAIRQRQVKRLRPLANFEQVLVGLTDNLVTSRTEGKIQKVASQLSNILINNLQARHILFFRKQRRYMEMNYVYGLKSIQRSRYRITLSNALLERLTEKSIIKHPHELREMLGEDLSTLLDDNDFNLVFPIFWQNTLFGVYFITTRLAVDHPLIRTFLLFLNQNLSATYQLTRMESTRQMLEDRVKQERQKNQKLENNHPANAAAETDDDPGYLIDMFAYRKVDDLIARLFDKVKAGLKAEKLAFIAGPDQQAQNRLQYFLGIDKNAFNLDGEEFNRMFGMLEKHRIYCVDSLPDNDIASEIRRRLKEGSFRNISTFSLADRQKGLLFWTGKDPCEKTESRILTRLEQIAHRAMTNAVEFEKIEQMSHTDSLTGLYNYRYFVKRLSEEIQRAKRYNRRVALLLFDIDDFKLYNDNFGHQWGDELLRRMGRTLASSLRAIDIVSRYGGDEFCIIMPEADKETCAIFMDRLRHAIAATDFRDRVNGFEGRITISIGGAIYPDDAEAADRLIYCSDMALLHAKSTGRNRSTAYSDELLTENSRH